MSNETEMNPNDEELSEALSSLRPAATSIDFASIALDRMQRCATRQVRTWRIAAALLLGGLVASVTLQVGRTAAPQPIATTSASDDVPPAPGPDSLLTLRSLVLEHGVQAIPDRPGPGAIRAIRPGDVPRVASPGGV